MESSQSTDSIRRIEPSQLSVGMYVTRLSGSAAGASGLKAKGLVTLEATVKRIQQLNPIELYIDISKGVDCVGSQQLQLVSEPSTEASAQAAPASSFAPQVAFEDEIENARKVRDRALGLIQGIMQDVKMGRSFDSEAVDAIAGEVIGSLSCNQNALLSLMRVRNMDQYLFEHSTNVAVLMGILARSMGIVGDHLQQLVFGAFVHDVGKILVPDAVLNKPGRLDADEWTEMKRHVDYGIDSLKSIAGIPPTAMEICAQHHERLDGSGYPLQLPAAEITLNARMAAVVDVYDAITADRVYHTGTEPSTALKNMLEWTDSHLDRDLVYQLIRCIGVYPAGAWVLLSSGEVALVREANLRKHTLPVVVLAYDTRQRAKIPTRVVDLAGEDSIGQVTAVVSPDDYGLVTSDYV